MPGEYLTLTQRKQTRTEAIRSGISTVRAVLSDYGRAHGGRFLLYGSAVRGDLHYDSDVDLLVDFPETTLADAWRFAENACWDRDLTPDIMPLRWCKATFLAHVAPTGEWLG